jgi:hypothetical protein
MLKLKFAKAFCFQKNTMRNLLRFTGYEGHKHRTNSLVTHNIANAIAIPTPKNIWFARLEKVLFNPSGDFLPKTPSPIEG